MNQYRSRISGYSSNIKMFGRQMADISNMGIIIERMHKKYTEYTHDGRYTINDYDLIRGLLQDINRVYSQFKQDHFKYQLLSKKTYDKRYNISPVKIEKNKKTYKVGKQYVKFRGDTWKAGGKYKPLFSGPWTMTTKLSDGTVIIRDDETNNEQRVSIDRLKPFNADEYVKCSEIYNEADYKEYQKRITKILYESENPKNYNFVDLDYTKRYND